MKKALSFIVLITVLFIACLFTGCATGSLDTKEKRCAGYGDIYSLYLATAEIREVTPEERTVAAAAAIFLRTYCGWTAPKGVGETLDANGVPVIYPPR